MPSMGASHRRAARRDGNGLRPPGTRRAAHAGRQRLRLRHRRPLLAPRLLLPRRPGHTILCPYRRLDYPHFTHHDFRHFFATTCIEAGIDIPTVSRWLGHKDGGALAMRVYGHLRQEHNISAVKKVSF